VEHAVSDQTQGKKAQHAMGVLKTIRCTAVCTAVNLQSLARLEAAA
jgi:hypothetical protein